MRMDKLTTRFQGALADAQSLAIGPAHLEALACSQNNLGLAMREVSNAATFAFVP